MFVSHKLSPSKKTFQKPNILRRKTKVTAIKSGPCKLSLAPTATTAGPRLPDTARNNTAEDWGVSRPGKKVQLEVLAQDVACRPSDVPAATSVCTHTQEMMDTHDQETNVEETLVDEIQHNTEPEVVDVEAFLNGGQTQYKTLYEAQSKLENSSVQKWQIDFENDTDEIIMEPYDELQEMPEDKSDADLPSLDCDLVTIRPGKFKCDEPDCNKAFVTEQKLRRHRGVHNKQRPPPPPPPPAAVECPAGEAAGVEGEGGRCRRVFAARDQLARHLREDHGPKDALHGCEECGRRFFWAVGLRAHARAHAAPGALHHCLWPGCGRAFRQPCRLREHARAHTGDRPYR
ncbi:zinc finger protein 358-like [Cydia strobilella]|uniref:zinc finger protein 358-like n=1 Tax=Cydia strobilella TaxID=1100964 RepID=UPI00300751FB